VASLAEGNAIRDDVAKAWVFGERLDVVSVEVFIRSAKSALVSVRSIDTCAPLVIRGSMPQSILKSGNTTFPCNILRTGLYEIGALAFRYQPLSGSA